MVEALTGIINRNENKNYNNGRAKERKLKGKYPNLWKESRKRKGKPFKLHNIDEIVSELNSITSPALY